ncbi:MAG: response regulator [Deltaproteobacteria bacterium]|jgi:putative two-component system response regulator|nr:response regulator [Deltaproteobacteria bacterium]
MKTLFIVDDDLTNLSVTEDALDDLYRVITLPSAGKMFLFLEKVIPDLILLDVLMPEMNGFEAIGKLKSHRAYSDIPVIFLTGSEDVAVEADCFRLGAVDFIRKPFSEVVLLRRVATHLNIDGLIRERTADLRRLQNGIISVLANMLENRDKNTGGHTERTSQYIKALIGEMKSRGIYADEVKDWDVEFIATSSLLHDVGKIAISDLILNKPDRLTNAELELIKTHTSEGVRIIGEMISRAQGASFLQHAQLFAGHHHERWDGQGYPHGLKGTAIPLEGRIMAVADVYDAMTSGRPYKEPVAHDSAVQLIAGEREKHFDPKLVDIFCDIHEKFREIKERQVV